AVALWCEAKVRFPSGISFYGTRENIIMLIPLKLQLPGFFSRVPRQGREGTTLLAQSLKLISLHFLALGIQPNLIPEIPCQLDRPFRLHWLLIGVECLEIDS